MKKIIFFFFLVLSSCTFVQTRGGWNYEAGLESIVGIGNFSGYIPSSLGPVGSINYKFPFSYFSLGGSLGVLFASDGMQYIYPGETNTYQLHKLTSLKVGLQSKAKLGNSIFSILINPTLFLPLIKGSKFVVDNRNEKWGNYYFEYPIAESSYYSFETSIITNLPLSALIDSELKFGFGIAGNKESQGALLYINLGVMIHGPIGY
jgi:hypothetical protein